MTRPVTILLKKTIFIIISVIFLGIAFSYFSNIYGWLKFRKNSDTPKEFLSHAVIKKEGYSKDSIEVLKQLQYLLNNHEQSFYIKDYLESTQLIIDTILYSPDFNKLAVLVITKNPTYRQLIPNTKYDWYYDGYCYLGIRGNDTINLTWITGGYSNSYDKADLSSSLREFYFRRFATIKNTSGLESKYNYNVNDIRFWDCPIWKEIEEDKIKKKEFEEEKIKHPENVYEPPKQENRRK